MIILQALIAGLLAAGVAVFLAIHDAREAGWHSKLPKKAIRPLIVFDVLLTLVIYVVLTGTGGLGWHVLAAGGVVTPRSQSNGWLSFLLFALTAASGSGLTLINARLPRAEGRLLMKRVSSVRVSYIAKIRSKSARHQTRDLVDNVLPALKALHHRNRLALLVQSWNKSSKVPRSEHERLLKLAKSSDDDSLLTLATDLCDYAGGQEFLADCKKEYREQLNPPQAS